MVRAAASTDRRRVSKYSAARRRSFFVFGMKASVFALCCVLMAPAPRTHPRFLVKDVQRAVGAREKNQFRVGSTRLLFDAVRSRLVITLPEAASITIISARCVRQ